MTSHERPAGSEHGTGPDSSQHGTGPDSSQPGTGPDSSQPDTGRRDTPGTGRGDVPGAGQVRLPRAVLIANRGEIASRIARTCRSMGIRAIGVASAADAAAAHVEDCDDVVMIGGTSPAESYLRIDALLEAAERAGADAVHPGFGFLAESPSFAQAVLDAGLVWVGPSPEVIAAMGDKLEAKRRMAAAGVPLVPGEELPDAPSAHDLREAAERIGLPIIVKAAAGGGGKGMRSVHRLEELAEAVASARREASGAFGDDRVFLERLIGRPRHVEVQIVGDTHGNVVHLFERECSVQRRHQKVVEECPSPGIDQEVRAELTAAATAAARALGYVSAGTVEFVVDDAVLARRRAGEGVPARDALAFLEVNTRLQVEHPVTEEVVSVRDRGTGELQAIDLVRWQLLIAGGWALPAAQMDLVARGHAIEVRLYAEDVPAGYLPATGTLSAFDVPAAPGVRRELGVRAGDVISPHYDPMLAKVIGVGPTRAEAAARLAAALAATPLLGVTTNRDLLVAVLRHDGFLAGATTTAYLDDHLDELLASVRPDPVTIARAAVLAAVAATLRGRSGEGLPVSVPAGFTNTGVVWAQHTYAPAGTTAGTNQAVALAGSAGGSEPVAGHDAGTGVGVDTAPGASGGDELLTVRLRARREGGFDAAVLTGVPAGYLDADGTAVLEARVEVLGHAGIHLDVEVDGHRQRAGVTADASGRVQVLSPSLGIVDLQASPRFPDRAAEEVTGATRSPMPGVVVTLAVAVGDEVAEGTPLVTIEAMKMEHRVTAPAAGTVAEVRVEVGQQVDAHEILVVVEP
jgi:propionyl-CoA carboxylase alpha chain